MSKCVWVSVSVCVCVCVSVCVWVCVCVWVWVSEWVSVYEWVSVWVSEWVCVSVSVSEWVCVCVSVCVWVWVCVWVCVCEWVCVWVSECEWVWVSECVCTTSLPPESLPEFIAHHTVDKLCLPCKLVLPRSGGGGASGEGGRGRDRERERERERGGGGGGGGGGEGAGAALGVRRRPVTMQEALKTGAGTILIFNPQRACAGRVTVVVLCVCVSVCLSTTILALQATRRLMSDTNSFSSYKGMKNNVAILLKRLRSRDMAWKQAKKPICIMSTGLHVPRPGLARSAHCGRIKLLRGYVSKSSAALTPMITQLACSCERYM